MKRQHETDPDRGATAVEYALLVGLIAVVIFASVATLGTRVFALYNVKWWP